MAEDIVSESAFKRGLSDAKRWSGAFSLRAIGIAVPIAAGIVARSLGISNEHSMLIAGVAAISLIGITILAAVANAPRTQRDEARRALEDCLGAKNTKRTDLAQIYAAGSALVKERPTHYGDWLKRKDEWGNITALFLRERYGLAEEQMFITPPPPQAVDIQGSIDARHNNQRLGLYARLGQLRAILDRTDAGDAKGHMKRNAEERREASRAKRRARQATEIGNPLDTSKPTENSNLVKRLLVPVVVFFAGIVTTLIGVVATAWFTPQLELVRTGGLPVRDGGTGPDGLNRIQLYEFEVEVRNSGWRTGYVNDCKIAPLYVQFPKIEIAGLDRFRIKPFETKKLSIKFRLTLTPTAMSDIRSWQANCYDNEGQHSFNIFAMRKPTGV